MKTKADILALAKAIREDLLILAGERISPRGTSWQDVAGTLKGNLETFAAALGEQRQGRMRFVGGLTPVETVAVILYGQM